MRSMQTAAVRSLAISPVQLTNACAEVALSLNDNKAQIYVKEGKGWVATETLAEVRHTALLQRTHT